MKNLIILLSFLAISCSGQEKNLPTNFDFGKTGKGIYTNDFFELEVNFNADWIVQDKQQLNQLVEMGTEMVTGDDQSFKSAVKASMVNVAYLLTVFKHELGAPVDFNPSFMIVAENTQLHPGIKKGSDYLFHTKKLLEQSQMAYYFEKEMFERRIGSKTFHILEAKIDHTNQTIIQEYISTVTNGFTLSFIISFTSEDDREELYEVLENIKM